MQAKNQGHESVQLICDGDVQGGSAAHEEEDGNVAQLIEHGDWDTEPQEGDQTMTRSRAVVWFSALNNWHNARTTKIKMSWSRSALTMLRRNRDSDARIFLAVAAASPGATREEPYQMPTMPVTPPTR